MIILEPTRKMNSNAITCNIGHLDNDIVTAMSPSQTLSRLKHSPTFFNFLPCELCAFELKKQVNQKTFFHVDDDGNGTMGFGDFLQIMTHRNPQQSDCTAAKVAVAKAIATREKEAAVCCSEQRHNYRLQATGMLATAAIAPGSQTRATK